MKNRKRRLRLEAQFSAMQTERQIEAVMRYFMLDSKSTQKLIDLITEARAALPKLFI